MKLKNKRNSIREFNVILKIEKDNNTYLVYHDLVTDRIYSGKLKSNKLKVLNDAELDYVNNVLERIWS